MLGFLSLPQVIILGWLPVSHVSTVEIVTNVDALRRKAIIGNRSMGARKCSPQGHYFIAPCCHPTSDVTSSMVARSLFPFGTMMRQVAIESGEIPQFSSIKRLPNLRKIALVFFHVVVNIVVSYL